MQMLELFAVHFRPKTINLFSGLCKSGLYQNYGWLRLELIRDWRVLSAKLRKSLLQQQTVRFLHVFHAQRTKFRTKESVSMSGYRPEKKRIIQCTQFADEAALKCFFLHLGDIIKLSFQEHTHFVTAHDEKTFNKYLNLQQSSQQFALACWYQKGKK